MIQDLALYKTGLS